MKSATWRETIETRIFPTKITLKSKRIVKFMKMFLNFTLKTLKFFLAETRWTYIYIYWPWSYQLIMKGLSRESHMLVPVIFVQSCPVVVSTRLEPKLKLLLPAIRLSDRPITSHFTLLAISSKSASQSSARASDFPNWDARDDLMGVTLTETR